MNYGRVLLAAAGGFVAYFAFGFFVFGLLPLLRDEYAKYPAVYRTQDSMKSVRSTALGALLLSASVSMAADFPNPAVDVKGSAGAKQTAGLAGGCFWCVWRGML